VAKEIIRPKWQVNILQKMKLVHSQLADGTSQFIAWNW